MAHRAPWECTFAKEEKSRCQPGIPPKTDQAYFEILALCILQAGLGWGFIRKNWQKYKQGFCNFNIPELANKTAGELLSEPGTIKNRRKVKAIINNAREFLKIKQAYQSFSNYLNSLDNKEAIKTIVRKFDHTGEYTAEYYLHSVGYRSRD